MTHWKITTFIETGNYSFALQREIGKNLRRYIVFGKGAAVAKQYQKGSYENDLPWDVDTAYFSRSSFYPDLLFVQELNNYQIEKLGDDFYYPELDFKDFMNYISNKYTGKLKEKILLIAFYTMESNISSCPPRPGVSKTLGEMERDPKTGRIIPDPEATFKAESTQKFIKLLEAHL